MDVIFCKGRTLASDIIAKVDDTDVSHVALASSTQTARHLIFHSISSGVRVSSRSAFQRKYDIKRIYRLGSSHSNEDDLLWSLFSMYEDRKYDYLAIAYLGLFLTLKKFGLHMPAKNLWNNRNHFICTEFVTLGVFGDTDSMMSLKSLEKYILEKSVYEKVQLF